MILFPEGTRNHEPLPQPFKAGLFHLAQHYPHVELVPVTGEFAGASPLVLTLAHPTEAAKDTTLTLARDTAGWTAPAQIDTSHDWNVQLATQDGLWRIRGRLQRDTQAVRLAPARGGG